MRAARFGAAGTMALAGVIGAAGMAMAAPKDGCPDSENWTRVTFIEAADTIFPDLLPGLYPWTTAEEFAAFLDALEDKNGDDIGCLRTTWGDHLNPNSKWYLIGVDALGEPTTLYTVRDNSSND